MRQRYTIELEMHVTSRATIEVWADTFIDARLEALERAARDDDVWEVERGPIMMGKVTAHAGLHVVPKEVTK